MVKYFACSDTEAVHKIEPGLRLAIWKLDLQEFQKRSATASYGEKPAGSDADKQGSRLCRRSLSLMDSSLENPAD
jgi:hypothetical protein